MENLDYRETEYERYCFDSTTLTLLIDFAMEVKVENALIEFVEEKIKDIFGIEKLQVYVYHGSQEDNDIYCRLEELCQCAGITFAKEIMTENELYEKLCREICPGKNHYFYKVSSEGWISICAKAQPGEYAVDHLLNGIDEEDAKEVEALVRKDPFLDEDCRDCHKLQNCYGGCAYEGREKFCML